MYISHRFSGLLPFCWRWIWCRTLQLKPVSATFSEPIIPYLLHYLLVAESYMAFRPNLHRPDCTVKGRDEWEKIIFGKKATRRHLSQTVVMVLIFFVNLATVLKLTYFRFRSLQSKWKGNVIQTYRFTLKVLLEIIQWTHRAQEFSLSSHYILI